MGRWRGKLLFALILYAAGFFTALYVLAPADSQAAAGDGLSGHAQSQTSEAVQVPAWAASARVGMDKALSFAEEKALQLAEKIKTGMQQSTNDTGN